MNILKYQEVIYTAEPQLRKPGQFIHKMFQDLFIARELAWHLFKRDISSQYRQTVFGYLWALFPPLVTSLTFILLNTSNLLSLENTGIPYPAYVIMGTVFYGLFVDALNAPLKLINEAKGLLVKINFPREALLMAGLGQVLLGFSIKLVLLIATLVIFKIPIQFTAFFAPIPLVGILMLGMMLGVFLVPVGVLFRDINYGLMLITQGLMFLTPVLYPPPAGGIMAKIMSINPLTPLIMSTREFILVGSSTYADTMLTIIFVTMVLSFLGWVLFRIALPILIERLGF